MLKGKCGFDTLCVVSALAAHRTMHEPCYATMGVYFHPSMRCGLLSCKDPCGMKGAGNILL